MAEYELNGDAWYYHGYEYHRGDVVQIPDDLDDAGKKHIEQLVEAGSLVDPGFAEKMREDQAKADEEAEQRFFEEIERNDAEAHRRVEAEQRRLHGDPKTDDDSRKAAEESAGNEGSASSTSASSKPASRRSSSSK